MSFKSNPICDSCGNETNSNIEVIRSAEGLCFTFNQSAEAWSDNREVLEPKDVIVKISIECVGKDDFHLCYGCLGCLCAEICDKFSEECHEDGDC